MAKGSKSCFIVFSAALVGSFSVSTAIAQCNPGGSCKVDVTVGANCAISVQPDPLDVPGPRRAKKITWTIVEGNFEFAPNGIEFKSPTNEFEDPDRQGKRFTWKNKHTQAGDFAYNVNVVSTVPNPTSCKLDPIIRNR